jgi:hypothetical protein
MRHATYGSGMSYEHFGVGPALTADLKAGPNVAQAATGLSLFVVAGPRWTYDERICGVLVRRGTGRPSYAFFGDAGASVVQVESVSGRFGVSSLSPRGSFGIFVRSPGHDWGWSFAAGAEYDQRFSEMPSTGYALVLVGIGTLQYGDQGLPLGGDCD